VPELEGAQHVAEGVQKKLVSADGGIIKKFLSASVFVLLHPQKSLS